MGMAQEEPLTLFFVHSSLRLHHRIDIGAPHAGPIDYIALLWLHTARPYNELFLVIVGFRWCFSAYFTSVQWSRAVYVLLFINI